MHKSWTSSPRLSFGKQAKRHLVSGVTSNLLKRIWEHRNDVREGFTKKYKVHQLVYFELFADMPSAIGKRERAYLSTEHRYATPRASHSAHPELDTMGRPPADLVSAVPHELNRL